MRNLSNLGYGEKEWRSLKLTAVILYFCAFVRYQSRHRIVSVYVIPQRRFVKLFKKDSCDGIFIRS